MHRDTSAFSWILGLRLRALGRALGTVLALAGCMGGQTGSEASADAGSCPTLEADGDTRSVSTVGAACEPIPPNDSTKLGFSAVQAVEVVSRLSALPLEWGSGEATTLTLVVTPSQAFPCIEQSGSGATLKVTLEITLTTADGRLNSRIPGTLAAEPTADGSIAALDLSGQRVCQSGDAASWALECGTSSELTLAGYAGLRVGLSARLQPALDGTRVLGTIQISGGLTPLCPSNPVLPCSPMQWEPVQGASFTSD
jgi:hypothetical protein